MMIHAVLGNPNHPEYGVATIPFPIPHDQYAHCMELLEALEIGDAVKADCQVQEINSFYSVLRVNNRERFYPSHISPLRSVRTYLVPSCVTALTQDSHNYEALQAASQSFLSYFHLVLQLYAIIW